MFKLFWWYALDFLVATAGTETPVSSGSAKLQTPVFYNKLLNLFCVCFVDNKISCRPQKGEKGKQMGKKLQAAS